MSFGFPNFTNARINWDSPQARGLVAAWLPTPIANNPCNVLNGVGHATFVGGSSNPLLSGHNEIGPAYRYDGSDDYRSVAHSSPIALTTNFGVSAWFVRHGLGGGGNADAIVGKWNTANTGGWSITPYGGTNVEIAFRNNSNYRRFASTAVMTDNVAYHAAFWFYGNGTTPLLWVNGIPQAVTTTLSGGTLNAIADSGQALTIGRSNPFAGGGIYRYWMGLVGEVRYYNQKLTDAVVSQMYAPQTRRELYQPTRPMVWWLPPLATTSIPVFQNSYRQRRA